MKPTPTFSPFCSDAAAAFSQRRTAGPSTEGGVRRQQHHVARPQAVDRFLVGVETHEAPLRGHVDPVAKGSKLLEAGLHAVLEQVGHGRKPHRAAGGRQGVGHGAGPPPPAADQGQPDRRILRGMNRGQGRAGRRRDCGDSGSALEELATRGHTIGKFGHGNSLLSKIGPVAPSAAA
jgi:hypothetical protein